jgi:hypothetical protein
MHPCVFLQAISETTFGGLSQLEGQKGLISYGGLIWTTLQRAKNAREAIHTMGDLVVRGLRRRRKK